MGKNLDNQVKRKRKEGRVCETFYKSKTLPIRKRLLKTLCKGKAAKTESFRVLSINPKNLPFKKPLLRESTKREYLGKNLDNLVKRKRKEG